VQNLDCFGVGVYSSKAEAESESKIWSPYATAHPIFPGFDVVYELIDANCS